MSGDDGDLLVVGSEDDDTLENDAGAVHVFERSGTTWTETAVLTASDAAADEHFGSHVDHEDGWIFVGNWGPNAFGFPGPDALYAFERTGSVWTEQQKLDGVASHKFGEHSAAFGPLLAMGEPDQSGGLGRAV